MKNLRRLGAVAAALLLVVGCSQDHTLAPTSPPAAPVAASTSGSHDLIGGLVGTVTNTLHLTSATGLQRTVALASDITVSADIGTSGGTLSIPAAGVTVIVPQGALSQTTTITMTAIHGTMVAYEFAPHGITFAKPLVFTQSLSGTNATILNAPLLKLGYFTDRSLLGQVTGLVSELLGGVVNVLNWSFTAPIKHFSGYIVCY